MRAVCFGDFVDTRFLRNGIKICDIFVVVVFANLHSYAVAVDLPLRSDHVEPLLLFITFKRLN